jgi:hypothetical protein
VVDLVRRQYRVPDAKVGRLREAIHALLSQDKETAKSPRKGPPRFYVAIHRRIRTNPHQSAGPGRPIQTQGR